MAPEPSPHEEGCNCNWCCPKTMDEFTARWLPKYHESKLRAQETPREAGKRVATEALFGQDA